jgi:hypothetical protein
MSKRYFFFVTPRKLSTENIPDISIYDAKNFAI